MAQKLTLRSTVNTDFTIEVDERVILSCSILQNVTGHTNDKDEVPVDMSKKQMQKFVEFHNHFATPTAEKDVEWSNKFFGEMPDQELRDLCWKADFLDSQRFLEASGDYILHKLDDMSVREIQSYLNIVDDYTAEERRTMEDHPLEFFTGISIQGHGEAAGPSTSRVTAAAAPSTSGTVAAAACFSGECAASSTTTDEDAAQTTTDDDDALPSSSRVSA